MAKLLSYMLLKQMCLGLYDSANGKFVCFKRNIHLLHIKRNSYSILFSSGSCLNHIEFYLLSMNVFSYSCTSV